MMKLYSYIHTSSQSVKLLSCAILSLPTEWSGHNFSSGELAVVASQLGCLLILPEVAGCVSLTTCRKENISIYKRKIKQANMLLDTTNSIRTNSVVSGLPLGQDLSPS